MDLRVVPVGGAGCAGCQVGPIAGLILVLASAMAPAVQAQNDYWPLPALSGRGFGFPCEPPCPGEPGVTLTRRYMLDGYPELTFCPRPADEVWLVSSRNMGGCGDDPERLVCKRAVGDQWEQYPLAVLLESQAGPPAHQNVVYVHGNQTDAFWARRRGKQVYQALVGCWAEAPPTRFVIWAWPADPADRPLFSLCKDFSQKQKRTEVDGFWLGYYLSNLPESADPLLLTYSLGLQVALNGLTDLQASGACRQYRMLAMAPVTRCHGPCPADGRDQAATLLRDLTLIRNSKDIALRAFRKYCQLTTPGCSGSGVDLLVNRFPGTRQFDVAPEAGREHNLLGYISLPVVHREWRRLSWQGRLPGDVPVRQPVRQEAWLPAPQK